MLQNQNFKRVHQNQSMCAIWQCLHTVHLSFKVGSASFKKELQYLVKNTSRRSIFYDQGK